MSKDTDLSELEEQVMQIVWSTGSVTAEDVRRQLAGTKELKDSTVRTVLRRIEEKGLLSHRVEGRKYVYRPLEPPRKVAARAVRGIIDRLCGGSVEALVAGMVDDELVDSQTLRDLAATIERSQLREGGDDV